MILNQLIKDRVIENSESSLEAKERQRHIEL